MTTAAWKPMLLIAAALGAGAVVALPREHQEALEAASSAPADSPHRQFDFWVGEWECFDAKGRKAGENSIVLECGGYVLRESWRSAGGGAGTSLNAYDRARGSWHQAWADSSGLVLSLDGGVQPDASMLLEGTRPSADGGEVLHRILWTPESDGTVRQTWESSADGGVKWQVLADLTYVRKPLRGPLDDQ